MNCLEDHHICHAITTQEQMPRPMKETLHSRHHSTVLSRLGASRQESPQNLHTHAVDSDTKLLGNNRVLKERPPPKTCSLATHTRLTCHQRIYGGNRWDEFVRLATSTTGTLTDLTTDLAVANNNRNSASLLLMPLALNN